MDVLSDACPSCGHKFTGKYCATCGEKRVEHHDFTIPHFIEETIEGLTHFDNKFFRSINHLITKPGSLTLQFEQGSKVPFMKPMQLFIVCNVLFFLIVGGINLFAIRLSSYLNYKQSKIFDYRNDFFQKVGHQADITNVSVLFQEKMINQSKAFIILFIPFFALTCALFFLRHKKPFGLHLVFATHFFSFLLLFFTLFYLLVELPNQHILFLSNNSFEILATSLNFSVLVAYFMLAARRFYQSKWIWCICTGLGAGFTFILLLQAYRIFLFYNIIRTF